MRISDWSSDVCSSDLANLGAEKTLTATAKSEGKAIGALETPEQQLGYFNDLPEEQQIAFLNATVDGLPDVEKDFGELIDRWAAGKPEQLAEKMNESLEITPELAQTLDRKSTRMNSSH